jgi:hypothetical protein
MTRPRWSKKTDELVRHVASMCRPSLQLELAHWLEDSPRFAAFVTLNRDKVRKKLNTAEDAEARLDVRAELVVAYLLLADRRFELALEAYGTGRRGPDLTVTYRANQRFNLEVTRLRSSDAADAARLAHVIAAKVRQLPADLPNGLLIDGSGLAASDVASAISLLKTFTFEKDDAYFASHGVRDARTFYKQFLELGGVLLLDEAAETVFVANRDARRPPPDEALARLLACLNRSAPK